MEQTDHVEPTESLAEEKRSIAQAAGLVMAAFILSRVLGLVREIAISRQFGTGGNLEAYLAAFRVPDLIFQLIAGGALGSAFIPTFTTYLIRGEREEAWRMASAVATWVLILLGGLAALGEIAAPWLARLVAPGFDPARQTLTAQLIRIMLLSSVIFGISGLCMATLNAFRHFALPAIAPTLYNLSLILAALFLSPHLDVYGLAIGVVIGAALHLSVQIPGLIRYGMRFTPWLTLSHPGVREVARLMAPRVLGVAVYQLNFWINTVIASTLPEGSLAGLNYAWLLMLLPQGVFAQAVATAAFPTFARLVAQDHREALREALSSTLRTVIAIASPAAIGLWVLRRTLVHLLFQRGAFTESSTEMVAWALAFYAWGIIAYAGVEIVTRAFYALHDTRTPVLVGVGTIALNAAGSLLLAHLFRSWGWMPHGGLALANTLATWIEWIALLALLRKRLGGMRWRQLLTSVGWISLSSTLMGLAVWEWLRLTPTTSAPIQAMGGISVGLVVYTAVTWTVQREELSSLLALLPIHRLRKKEPTADEKP